MKYFTMNDLKELYKDFVRLGIVNESEAYLKVTLEKETTYNLNFCNYIDSTSADFDTALDNLIWQIKQDETYLELIEEEEKNAREFNQEMI